MTGSAKFYCLRNSLPYGTYTKGVFIGKRHQLSDCKLSHAFGGVIHKKTIITTTVAPCI